MTESSLNVIKSSEMKYLWLSIVISKEITEFYVEYKKEKIN
jgi:hypothetical protein